MREISLHSRTRTEMINITDKVQRALDDALADAAFCIVFTPHTTAAVTINENADPDVPKDMLAELNKVIPFSDSYAHDEGNSAAHIKSTLVGASVVIPVEERRLQLGRWQGIFFCEFDGPRERQVWIQTR